MGYPLFRVRFLQAIMIVVLIVLAGLTETTALHRAV
ncbi:hypothetical protein SCG7109_AB_00350 [Chlamydiales bacterium SCGC AG-110-M15]|nr:hypothetical protein SCG7109_AB_00350 [Chlamydiales bacterium SCGC AG-110-M15]